MAKLGIDLGGTNIRAASVYGKIMDEIHSVPVDKSKGRDGVINQIISIIERFQSTRLQGIGIGVPSYVDIEQGIIYDTVNLPDWDEVPLKQILEKRFNIPVSINNDANCFALGEFHFGKGILYDSIVGVTIGTGLGAGIIVNGELYAGRNCGAGEIGALRYLDRDYEFYTSSSFFSELHQTPAHDAFELARQGDENALKIFSNFGSHLGEVVKLVLHAYDPQAIILGGSIAKAWSFYQHSMFDAIQKTSFRQYVKNLKIEVSTLENAGIFGAAQLVRNSNR